MTGVFNYKKAPDKKELLTAAASGVETVDVNDINKSASGTKESDLDSVAKSSVASRATPVEDYIVKTQNT